MKHILKNFSSPGLKALLRERHEYRNTRTYASWDEAVDAAKNDYEDGLLARFRVARALANKDAAIRSDILHLCAGMLGPEISITDFGGATGYYGATLLREFSSVIYTVVETPVMVDHAKQLQTAVRFQSDLPTQCDVFFTSGTLAYLDDPIGALQRGLSSARHIAVLARNCFCKQEIFRVQTSHLFDNGAGTVPYGFMNVSVRYAHRTIIKDDVLQLASSMGFRLLADFADPYNLELGVLPYRHRAFGGTLVFGRI